MLNAFVQSWLMPPGGILLLLVLAFFLVRGVLGRMLLFIAWVSLGLMSLPLVAGKLMEGLETLPGLTSAGASAAEGKAILILGARGPAWAPEYGGATVDRTTLARLRYGAFLHRLTGLPVFVAGGAPADGGPPMARLMAGVLKDDWGIEVAGVEEEGRTLWSSAERSAPLLRAAGVDKVLLVTSAWQMPRAVDVFQGFRVAVTAAPTDFFAEGPGPGVPWRLSDLAPSMAALAGSSDAIGEYLMRAWYQVRQSGVDAQLRFRG